VTGFGSVNYPKFLAYYLAGAEDSSASTINHYQISFHVLQSFSSAISASEIRQDASAFEELANILRKILAFLDIAAVKLNGVSDLVASASLLAIAQTVQVDYNLVFERNLNESQLESHLVQLRYELTLAISDAVVSGNFTEALVTSKSSALMKLASIITPSIPEPEVQVFTSSPVSPSPSSSSSSSLQIGAIVGIVIGGVAVIILVGVAVIYRLRYIRQSTLLMEDFGVVDSKISYSIVSVSNDPFVYSTSKSVEIQL
jgi:hypothetical protein